MSAFSASNASEPTRSLHPIRYSLPGQSGAYTHNQVVEWLLTPWEESTVEAIAFTRNFYAQHMNPATADAGSLDWLAQFAGYTGPFWDSAWPESVKRSLISEAYTRVWPQRGSLNLLGWLFNLFGLNAEIDDSSAPFLADINEAGDALGGSDGIFHVLLPMLYSRQNEWLTVEKLLALFIPCWADYTLSYEESQADFLRAGEVVTE